MDLITAVTVLLPSLELGEEYIVIRNIRNSLTLILLCSLLRLFVTSIENFPLIFRILRRAMATVDRFCGPVADGVPWPASAHGKIKRT